MASLEYMKMTGYTDEQFQSALPGEPYIVMINPDSIKLQHQVEYNKKQAPGSSSASQRYSNTPSETMSFDIVIDCTGIVDTARVNMSTEISTLENIIYTYNGDIHRPNFVQVQWGQNLSFKGVMTSYDISYTVFNPNGNPLRAKISLSFTQYIAPATVSILDKDASPDMTHIVAVADGITLPQLCQQVWKNNMYYTQVARYNNLNKFRNLSGIKQLIFPPIIQPVN